jgi:hypothetical protein
LVGSEAPNLIHDLPVGILRTTTSSPVHLAARPGCSIAGHRAHSALNLARDIANAPSTRFSLTIDLS